MGPLRLALGLGVAGLAAASPNPRDDAIAAAHFTYAYERYQEACVDPYTE